MENAKVKVLWLSRHKMTSEQDQDLSRVFGNNIEVIQVDKTVEDINDIISDDIDAYAVVLPTDKLIELARAIKAKGANSRIITAQSERIACGTTTNPATGNQETQYKFVHKAWIEYSGLENANVVIL